MDAKRPRYGHSILIGFNPRARDGRESLYAQLVRDV